MNSASERTWVEQAARDPEVFTALYRRYAPRLYAYAAHRLPAAQDAEDVVSEVFVRVVSRLRDFRWQQEGSFAAWLFRIAHNLIVDFYREPRVASGWADGEPGQPPDGCQQGPEAMALHDEEFAYVRALIGQLSPRQQEIIALRFFGGLRNQEIAAALGLDERTVAAHLCRGLEELHRKRQRDLSRQTRGGP